jgi:hypothetical protein
MKKLSIFFFSAALFVASHASAIGILVNPSQLSVEARTGEEATVRLQVKNPSDKPALFQASPDSLGDMVRAFPASFTLESAEERDIVVRVLPSRAGVLAAMLSVTATPLSGDFHVGSGVKIPLTIHATANRKPFATIFFSASYLPWTLLGIVLVAFTSVEVRRKLRKTLG